MVFERGSEVKPSTESLTTSRRSDIHNGMPHHETVVLDLTSPSSPISKPHTPNFLSYSFEPAFWTEFFGEPSSPRNLTFTLLNHLHERGVRPIIRPGGITMDSMIYNASQSASVVRTENGKGGIYRTTVGPNFYRQWSNFPSGTKFTAPLNFGNASITIAIELARAAFSLQRDKILFYELGNEPTNYPSSRWRGSTEAYIAEWLRYTGNIGVSISSHSVGKWWASSATTDNTSLKVRPADLIPLGINRTGNVAQYSIHSYAFATCDPARERRATIENILNHTDLVRYADTEIYPSARAAMNVNATWAIGEFNSIACSGKPGVSDTFAQALWTVDVELIYAVRNASSVHLHQGATLVFQSNQQLNTPGDDGTPGFSSYSLLYPVDSSKRGKARVLPVFVSQLLVAEALKDGGRIAALQTPSGVKVNEFSGYAIFDKEGRKVIRLVILNMKPYYKGGSAPRRTVDVDIGAHQGATVKRMTAPSVDEKFTGNVTWAGQSFMDGPAVGEVVVEDVPVNGKVAVRDSEAVLVIFK
ncbi:beta-glucuronidase [Naviculisporaceae sp. PSN 640]